MSKKMIFNDGKTIKHIGNKAIPPGEWREVDEAYLDPEPSNTEDEEPQNPYADLEQLLTNTVPEVVYQLGGCSDEELIVLARLEEQSESRSTLLSALAEEQLNRASHDAPDGNG